MSLWLAVSGVTMAALSALALYAGSPHCMWLRLRGHPLAARLIGLVLAFSSLAVWVFALGVATGLCAMLVGWLLALVMRPWLAMLAGWRSRVHYREDRAETIRRRSSSHGAG